MKKPDWQCSRKNCGNEREGLHDEYPSSQCCSCNDREIEDARERAEFDYYHPSGE